MAAAILTRVVRPRPAALVMQACLAVGLTLLVLALVMQAGLAGWADPPNHMLGKARRIMLGKALGAHLEQVLQQRRLRKALSSLAARSGQRRTRRLPIRQCRR